MLSSLAFSLVLLTPGHIEYGASFSDLKTCEAEVQRLRPQLKGTNTTVVCMPVNTVTDQNVDRHIDEMFAMMNRMRERMEKQGTDQVK
jgi:hypothetical protein